MRRRASSCVVLLLTHAFFDPPDTRIWQRLLAPSAPPFDTTTNGKVLLWAARLSGAAAFIW